MKFRINGNTTARQLIIVQRLSLDHGGHLVNQPRLKFTDKGSEIAVGHKIKTVRKTSKQTQNMLRKHYRRRKHVYAHKGFGSILIDKIWCGQNSVKLCSRSLTIV